MLDNFFLRINNFLTALIYVNNVQLIQLDRANTASRLSCEVRLTETGGSVFKPHQKHFLFFL